MFDSSQSPEREIKKDNFPLIVYFDYRYGFTLSPSMKKVVEGSKNKLFWKTIEMAYLQDINSNKKDIVFPLASLAIRMEEEGPCGPYRPTIEGICKASFQMEDESWIGPMRSIYQYFSNTTQVDEVRFKAFVENFHKIMTGEEGKINISSGFRQRLFGVMHKNPQSAEVILDDLKNDKCDPRLILIVNGIILAFAKEKDAC